MTRKRFIKKLDYLLKVVMVEDGRLTEQEAKDLHKNRFNDNFKLPAGKSYKDCYQSIMKFVYDSF